MATEVLQHSSTDTDQASRDGAKRSGPGNRGPKNRSDSDRNVIRVGSRKTPGFDTRRFNRPQETRERTRGEVKTLEGESEISQELRDRFSESLQKDMLQLIDLRKKYNNEADFKKMLEKSGHSYYIELFDKLVQEQPMPGTNNRSFELNQEALNTFMSVDKGVVTAYRIKQRKLQEQALAVRLVMGINPNEPENGLPDKSDLPLTKPGILRRGARRSAHWLGTTRTSNGRPKTNIFIDKNWKLTLVVGGVNVAGAVGGGLALGPPGAFLGVAAAEGALGIVKGFKKGERERAEISNDALRTLLGDKNSPTPEKQVRDRPKIEWMKDFYNIDPEDYAFDADGELVKVRNVGNTGEDLKGRLMDTLRGEAKLVEDFQKDNSVPPELRRPMDISWIFDASKSRPRQNTPDEKAIMDEFKADFGGIQDRDGNFVMKWDIERDTNTRVPRETVTTARKANYDVDALFHFNAGDTVPAGTEIPFYTDPTTGRPAGGRRARPGGEVLPVAIDTKRRTFLVGETIPAGTIIPAHRDASNKYVPEERITAPKTADHQFMAVGRRIEDGENIPADTVLESHYAPMFDTDGKQVKKPVENIPPFDWNNLDITGNAERWMQAEEKVLKRYVNEVFQGLVDGETDHRMNVWERLHKAREGHASGKMVDAETKSLTRERDALKKDTDTLSAENQAFDTYQKKVAEKRLGLSKLRREADVIVRGIRINGARSTDLDAIQTALQNTLNEGNKVPVTIGGQTIESIEDEYIKLDSEIGGKVDDYIKLHVDPAAQAVARAEAQLVLPGTNQEIAARARALEAAQRKEQSAREAAQRYEQTLRESDRYKKKADRIEARRKLIQDAIDKLSESNDALSDARAVLTSNETEGREESTMTVTGMEMARERIAVTWSIPGALTDQDLATKSYDDLVKLINRANQGDPTATPPIPPNPTIGWPENANSSAENRLLLLHAMAEARARLVEPQVSTPDPFIRRAAQPDVNLSELDLYALTAEEIYATLPATLRTPNKAADLARIGTLKEAVRKRFTARQTALDQVRITIDDRTVKLTERLDKIIEKGISVPQVDAIERAMDRYPDTIEGITKHMPEQADRDKLFAYELNPTTGATEVNEDKAYENMMNLIFNHKEDYNVSFKDFPPGPQAAFERNKTVLSKQELADALYKHFRLSIPGATPKDVFEAVRRQDPKRLANFFANTLVLEHFVNKIP